MYSYAHQHNTLHAYQRLSHLLNTLLEEDRQAGDFSQRTIFRRRFEMEVSSP